MALPKTAVQTISFVDEYCNAYKDIFSEVRTFENFKFLHLGIMSEIHRKSLTGIAKVVGLKDSQRLNNFLKNSPWDVEALRDRRLMWLKKKLNHRSFILVINEIGDKKKGKTTDYVAKQYIDRLAKTENAIVSVNAYGVLDGITFPLIFKVFKPQRSLELSEKYSTKPQLAIAIIEELKEMGFNFELVMVEKIYRNDAELARIIDKLSLKFMPPNYRGQEQYTNHKYITNRVNLEASSAEKLDPSQPAMLPEPMEIKASGALKSSWYIKGERQDAKVNQTGEIYNFVNWVEYGFKQVKEELGWGDFRVTNYRAIEKWWEMVFSVYWMISLHSSVFQKDNLEADRSEILDSAEVASICFLQPEIAWHHRLTDLKSIIQL